MRQAIYEILTTLMSFKQVLESLVNIGTISSGAITTSGLLKISRSVTAGSPMLDLHNTSNASGVDIRFTDVAAGTSQFGHTAVVIQSRRYSVLWLWCFFHYR